MLSLFACGCQATPLRCVFVNVSFSFFFNHKQVVVVVVKGFSGLIYSHPKIYIMHTNCVSTCVIHYRVVYKKNGEVYYIHIRSLHNRAYVHHFTSLWAVRGRSPRVVASRTDDDSAMI